MNLKKLIKDYLKEAKLMQLSTAVNNQPWTCNVWFAADSDLNIYWFSSTKRRHSKEVEKKSKGICRNCSAPHTQGQSKRLTASGHRAESYEQKGNC